MVKTELLEQKIKEAGKTKSYLAEKLGITIQTFKRKCDNKNEFMLSETETLCRELNIKKGAEMTAIFFAARVD